MNNRRGILVDTFAGAGGLSFGMESAGFDVAVSVDVEPVNAATHGYMYSYGRAICADLFEDQSKIIRENLGNNTDPDVITMGRDIDAIVGGPPCQGISSMGRRDPNDPRNMLMDRFIHHGISLNARLMCMEQVPTILQDANREHLDHIREKLFRAGYSMVDPQIVRAVDFGVPQRRERVFLLIHRNDQKAPSYPKPTHSPEGDFFLKRTPTVADAFDGLPDACNYEELWHTDNVQVELPHPTTHYGRLMACLENDSEDLSYKRPHRRDILTCSQRTRHDDISIARFMATQPGGSERISRRHRLDPNGLSLTLRAGSNAERGSFTAVMPIHPKGTRMITVREAARLHSFPDHYIFSRTKISALRQIGNSVVPKVGQAIGRELMVALDLSPSAPTDIVPYGDPKLLETTSIRSVHKQAA